MTDAKDIGERVRAERERRGWNQADLSRRSGLAPSAVSQIESGAREPSPRSLAKLAVTLAVTTDYLLGLRQEQQQPTAARMHCPACGQRHYIERI